MQLSVNYILIKVLEMFRTKSFTSSNLILTKIIDVKLLGKFYNLTETIGIIFSFRDICLLVQSILCEPQFSH